MNLIADNVRPQSAGILNKLNQSKNNIIDARLRQLGLNVDLRNQVIERQSKPSRRQKRIIKRRTQVNRQRV